MSQPDETDDAKASARAKRRAPVIELTAAEVPPSEPSPIRQEAQEDGLKSEKSLKSEQAAQTHAAVEPQALPEPQATPATVQKPSIVMPLALAAIIGGLCGAVGGGFIPRWFGAGSTNLARVAKLERDWTQLPKATDMDAIKQAITRLEGDVAKRLADSGKRVDDRLTAFDTELKAVAAKPAVEAVAKAPIDGTPNTLAPGDLAPLTQRLASLEVALKALDGKTEGTAKLSERVDLAAKRLEAGGAAPLFATGQALALAFHRGAPFGNELLALEALGAKPDDLQPLKMFALTGAPTPQRLAEAFSPLATRLAENQGESGKESFNPMVYLQRFIKIRPAGETKGDTPSALVATIEAALGKGDMALAIAAWGRLPEPARNLSSVWAAQASDRDRAGKALAAFQESTLASLRKSRP